MKDIFAVKKIYETISDEINDPKQGVDVDDNIYRKDWWYGGWAIDHPDGSTTIIVRGEPLVIPPREWLIQDSMGQWHDPNDLVKEGSSSDSESQSSSKESSSKSESDYEYASDYSSDKEDITTEGLFKPRKGFNYPVLDQLDLLLSQTRNMNELFLESINITRDTIPAEVWAKSQAEFLSPESNMYRHLDEMKQNLGSAEEVLSYIHYRAAARAYDVCQITNNKENIPMMQQIFNDNVKAIMDSLEK